MMRVFLLLLTFPVLFVSFTSGDETEIEVTLLDYSPISFAVRQGKQRVKREVAPDLRVELVTNANLNIRSDASYIKDNLISPALQQWIGHLKPTHPMGRKLQVRRKCEIDFVQLETEADGIKQEYCVRGCAPETRCGDYIIPDKYLSDCRTYDRDTPINQKNGGEGVLNKDLLLITDVANTFNCRAGSLAHTQICEIDPDSGRPTVSYMNLCPAFVNAYKTDKNYQYAIVLHELGHALGFSNKMFAFMSDENGQPRTPRDPATNLPILGMTPPYIYTPSPTTLAEFNETYVSRVAEVDRLVQGLRTPAILAAARKYFGCMDLHMVQLENQGSEASAGSHFEKRLYNGDIMTASPGIKKDISNILLAYFEDSGWYYVNYAGSVELTWGANLGCDFALKSCYEYKYGIREERADASPWCFELARDCRLKKYAFALDPENQYLKEQSGIPPADLPDYAGRDSFMDYCPYTLNAD